MRAAGVLLAAAVFVAGCDQSSPVGVADGSDLEPAFHHAHDHLNAQRMRAWGNDIQWGMIMARPPAVGPGHTLPIPAEDRVRVYQIAPIDPSDPLSPPIELGDLGLIVIGGRDHVLRVPNSNQGNFRAIGRTVPVLHPGWNPSPPFNEASCNVFADLGSLEARIAWERSEPVPHPCGWAARVFGAQLDGEPCARPLTSVERVEAAEAQGLAVFAFPTENPWNFSISRLTVPGQGQVVVEAPECVPSGERLPEA